MTTYVLTLHMQGINELLLKGVDRDRACEEMRKQTSAYKSVGLNPIDITSDYATFRANTGELIGLWVHESAVYIQQKPLYGVQVADIPAQSEATQDYTVGDQTPTDGLFDDMRELAQDGYDIQQGAQNG